MSSQINKRLTFIWLATVVVAMAAGLMLRRAILAPDPFLDSSQKPAILLLTVTNDTSDSPVALLQFTNNTTFQLKPEPLSWGYYGSNGWVVNQPITATLSNDFSSLSWLRPGEGSRFEVHFPTNGVWNVSILFQRPEPLHNRGLLLRARYWLNRLRGGKPPEIEHAGGYLVNSSAIHDGFSAKVRNETLLNAAADLVILYMEDHEGGWPHGWRALLDSPSCRDFHSRLRDATEAGQFRYLARPEDFEHYVDVDWHAEPSRLRSAGPQKDVPSFHVIRSRQPSSAAERAEIEANQKILDYLWRKHGDRQE